GVHFEIVYGISGNQRAWYDNANAARLGYRPQDDSEDYADQVLRDEKQPADARAEVFQGGSFVSVEVGGDPNKPLVPR
ncbi:MAG TPA: hypothetical protein VM122_01445, partial [Usitatibacter sp.]|nr:hypothetical protein [Usitatibacter sp.]